MTPAAARQYAFAAAVLEAELGAAPPPAAVLDRWPDVAARPWFPDWPYGPLPAGVDWRRVVAALVVHSPAWPATTTCQ